MFAPRHIVLVVMLMVIPLSVWLLAYRPANEGARRAVDRVMHLSDHLAQLEEVNHRERLMNESLEEIRSAMEYSREMLPAESSVEHWLDRTWQAAEGGGMVVKAVTATGSREQGGMMLSAVEVEVSGDFAGFHELLQRLERIPQLSRIERMQVEADENGHIDASFSLHLFFSKEPTS